MAFHIACPITCRQICDCELGFPAGLRGEAGKGAFLDEIDALEEFLSDPWTVRPDAAEREEEETVQVWVPRVSPAVAVPSAAVDDRGAGVGDEVKRALLQRQALAASLAAEDYVRRLEAGGTAELLGEATSNLARDDQGVSTVKVMCHICFSGEIEGSEKVMKMLLCKSCNRKYHRSCLKTLVEHRDLFHWSLWSCPACRICEVCRRTGDPNKLMYCKRCDGAYHCYCQHPPHKNVSRGPYLCPKHTRCHSCGSTVSGSGLSTRWFLGYTCCDACGRLFVKGNYCPICLKVYRDSETTPMVCCDVCERWVHCLCDGISDEKYQQFQADQNLQYKCAACRGDCYQVEDIDDAVRELWKRKDIADNDLIASLRAAAGLPSHEVTYSISPYSGDEQSGPIILKNDNNKPLKFSLKGISDKSSEYGNTTSNKKQVKKKGYWIKLVGKTEEAYPELDKQDETRSLECAKMVNANVMRTPKHGVKEKTKVKIGKVYVKPQKSNGNVTDECDLNATDLSVERMNEANFAAENDTTERSNKVCQKKHSADIYVKPQRDSSEMSPSDFTSSSSKDLKTSLKLKFKNPCFEQKSSWAPHVEEDNTVKGQRSKRKRPSTEKMGGWQDDRSSKLHLENLIDEAMDANWILQKLGKDAIGKRVEVQPTNSSWHQGVVIDVNQSTSSLSVHLDDGRSTLLELGKQGLRFISQKQRTKS
ncbi:uncharacterized protein LOC135626188 isoform X2 [Musa acuminata AAA Group]|uniref:uncharacterized protein LOC135626188 isoform X2 n=1 Tax=Musa acuminata AAA Group TaxID=214697 RepID=UPI0031CFD356